MSRAQTRSRSRAPSRKPEAGPGAASSLQSKKMIAGLSALLGALTIALYSPVLGHSFVVFDDRDYVTENPHIRGGLAWKTIRVGIHIDGRGELASADMAFACSRLPNVRA